MFLFFIPQPKFLMTILLRIILASWLFILSSFCFAEPSLAISSPDMGKIIFDRGVNNLHQQNYQNALVDFTQVITAKNNLTGAAYSNRCLAELQLQQNIAAEADCKQAIKNNVDNLEAHLNLGLAYYHQQQYVQAIAEYQEVIKRDNQDYRAYYNRGLAYIAANNHRQAIGDYQKALNLAKDSTTESKSTIYNDLALAQIIIAQETTAILNLNRAIALNKNNYQAYYNRGCAYHRQGNNHAAIQDFSAAIQLQPSFTQAYVHRGIVHHHLGANHPAVEDFNLALGQYRDQNDQQQYDLVLKLKHQLFYAQPHQIV